MLLSLNVWWGKKPTRRHSRSRYKVRDSSRKRRTRLCKRAKNLYKKILIRNCWTSLWVSILKSQLRSTQPDYWGWRKETIVSWKWRKKLRNIYSRLLLIPLTTTTLMQWSIYLFRYVKQIKQYHCNFSILWTSFIFS